MLGRFSWTDAIDTIGEIVPIRSAGLFGSNGDIISISCYQYVASSSLTMLNSLKIALPSDMDYNCIDQQPRYPGWGRVFQGSAVGPEVFAIASPMVIVCMNRDELDEPYINHKEIQGVLSVWIDDAPTAVLPDSILVSLVDAGIALLKQGVNLYVHCQKGVSRSSYYTIALNMRLGMSFKNALAYVRAGRPVANPNAGFMAQLQSLDGTIQKQ